MPTLRLILAASAVLGGLIGGVGRADAADPAMYAYVVLGQGDTGAAVPMARVIVTAVNQTCPSLTVSGQPTVPMSPRTNPNTTNFPVTVCEAIYPVGRAYQIGSIALPKVALITPDRVVALGDTGCRNDAKQACDSKSWPLSDIAGSAAKERPDLLIHVGDYNYRGTPSKITLAGQSQPVHVYDAGDADDEDGGPPPPPKPYYSQNMAASPKPDQWSNWQADFFDPATKMLTAAPWVFVRGNHELCSRAGPGFLYFLDSGSALLGAGGAQIFCPNQDGPAPLYFGRPYQITLGSLALAVIDTANADDTGLSYASVYGPQLAEVVKAMAGGTPTWVVTHRPFWGVIKGAKDPKTSEDTAVVINDTLQNALGAASGKAFPSNVGLVVSGHMHRFQAMGFAGGRPPQLIVGTGGVGLSKTFPKQNKKDLFTMTIAGAKATGVGLSEFGLMRIDVGKKGAWTGKLKDPAGKTLADCTSAWASAKPTQAVCTLN